MDRAIGAVRNPKLLLIRGQRNSVTGAAMTLHRALLIPVHLYVIQLLATLDVPDLKTEQAVDVDEHEGVASVDRERPNYIIERSYGCGDLMCFWICNGQELRFQTREINTSAVGGINRVV